MSGQFPGEGTPPEENVMPTPLDTLLTQSDPLADNPPDTERLSALSTALAHDVVEADRALKGRRLGLLRRHKWAAIAAAAVVVVPTTAYAASALFAHTGTFGDPVRNPDFEDGSEYIEMCAADYSTYVTSVAPTDLPAPPHHPWASYAPTVMKVLGGCEGTSSGTFQASQVALSYIAQAHNDWGCAYVWATEDGDTAGARTAHDGMNTLTQAADRIAPTPGTHGVGISPETFLANSKLPQWVGCKR
ncbi:hypothetical protein JNB_11299 [Janibacter sp. HTCC2649]|uniref:hypothetical protein n=1 Tax=Janibacter sp. HTCC2649 TaxID=313589 RepID=UPI0000670BA1|nr:hypothetical protein [Janibacter sp. HTCC2649]EAQ00757.1 hypothetical protein JNB_11299 [Janibacter sp. HTCC2649]